MRVLQNLGSTYTVYSDYGLMYRIDAKDAGALGLEDKPRAESAPGESEPFSEKMVWDQLKTVYDPEIPVNIYEMGLIYDINVEPSGFVGIRMTLTSPACPAAQSLPVEVDAKVREVPGVTGVSSEVKVFRRPVR